MTHATDILPPLRAAAETYGMAKLARETGSARPSLYRMLADDGNPRLGNLMAIISVLGMRVRIDRQPVNVLDLPACPHCKKSREDFAKRSTCAYGGCPWGGDF